MPMPVPMLRAILVDDESYTRQGLLKLIDWEACGFRVVGEADNGEDALELIARLSPDLVVTDIRMPVMDGLELIRRTAVQGGGEPAFIIVSGYDDFKYAQTAVRYGVYDFILKPIDESEFAQTLRKLADRLERERASRSREEGELTGAAIEALLLGEASPAIEAQWEEKLLPDAGSELIYALAELNDRHPWRTPAARELPPSAFKALVRDALNGLIERGDRRAFGLHEHRNRVGILFAGRLLRPFGGDAARFGSALRRALAEAGEDTWLYVGSPVRRLKDVRRSYETARQALQYKFVEDGARVLVYDRLAAVELQHTAVEGEAGGELAEQIELGDDGAIAEAVDRLFRTIRERRLAPEAVKTCIQLCVLAAVRTIRGMDGDERSLASLAPIVGWNDLHLSPAELKRLLVAFALESARLIRKLRSERAMGGIGRIKAYIDAHYRENISLKSIAAQFYMNPVYLGQLFRKAYGHYFNDYVLQLRIREAKLLLRQTDLRIYEIAERVGFGSADYFVTQFEKREGCTPTEYRVKLRQRDEERDEAKGDRS